MLYLLRIYYVAETTIKGQHCQKLIDLIHVTYKEYVNLNFSQKKFFLYFILSVVRRNDSKTHSFLTFITSTALLYVVIQSKS